VAESTTRLPEGELSITTTGFEPVEAGGPVSYVQSIAVDGKTLERPWISGRELRHIRNLHIELGPQPSRWGTRIRPPSTSDPLHATGGEA
jgi:putative alpha-1,2-mannosidase